MQRIRICTAIGTCVFFLFPALFQAGLSAQENLLANPDFTGTGGAVVGEVTGQVPDSWRTFAVGGGTAEIEVVPVAAGELFEGSPATSAVLFRVTNLGADQGFDNDNARFDLVAGAQYHAEFYIKTGNTDASDQTFNFGFPLFGAGGYLGVEPGGQNDNTATSEWQHFVAPTFEAPAETTNGHISWRCTPGGAENAILIALPSVFPEQVIVDPTALVCEKVGGDVQLSWINNETYDQVRILRDAAEIAVLDGAATSYLDEAVPQGEHEYQVLATFNAVEGDGPTCQVAVFEVAIGTTVSVDLGTEDVVDGLENSQRDDGSDGENEPLTCGPAGDQREARSNLGSGDNDAPDGQFYFNVTDAPMKAQDAFVLQVTVYDDPARAGAGLYLQFTNQDSTGPGDIPNTFFPLADPPARTLAGTDAWVVLTWQIAGAGFRSFMQGSSDFRLGVTDGERLCIDRVDLTYFPVPAGLSCLRTRDAVELAWTNSGAYDSIKILRNGTQLEELTGDATSYVDAAPVEGEVTYDVLAVVGGLEVGPSCTLTVAIIPEGTRVSVDLAAEDVVDGLENSQRGFGTDGQNEATSCGPEGDVREARSNIAGQMIYFNVTDEGLKSQGSLRIEATVYDDPARAGAGLALQYTNGQSTGPGDIPNTFFPQADLPTRLLEGTDAWVVVTWEIEDAGFRQFMQGTSDFRLSVTDGGSLCIDRVEVVYPSDAGPGAPIFHRGDADSNDAIEITDGIFILNFLFLGSDAPQCMEAANPNDDAQVDITDGIYMLNYLFLGGPAPVDPGPTNEPCGPDPEGSPNDLGCESYPPCEAP